jgi:hypothetical protein
MMVVSAPPSGLDIFSRQITPGLYDFANSCKRSIWHRNPQQVTQSYFRQQLMDSDWPQYAEGVPLVTGRRVWLQRDRGHPQFSGRNRIFGRKVWRKMDWEELTAHWAHFVSRLKRIRFPSVGLYDVGVHGAGNLEGRHQSIEATKEATVGSSSCGDIQWHDWQHAQCDGTCAVITLTLACCCKH